MKDRIYIERIKKYAFKIFKYLEGIDKIEDFETNDEKVDAVIFNLEQIGETAKKITDQTKNMYKSIHWVSIIGLRNIISHDYEGVRLSIIYEIAKYSITMLLEQLSMDIDEHK